MRDSFSPAEWARLTSLLSGPEFPEREYLRSGYTFADVYAMAAWLCAYYAETSAGKERVCLATENKAVIAAALLASLGGGPVLLLPYALSRRVLEGIQQRTGFTRAIADAECPLPAGVDVVCPQPVGTLRQAAVTGEPVIGPHLLQLCTGGTTGMPQLWSKTAANIFKEAFFLARWLRVTERDCIVATVSPCHIYGLLFSVVLPLVTSATVLDTTPSFPREIINAVQEEEGTVLVSVPNHFSALQGKKISEGSLRLAVSSAGMLDRSVNEGFAALNAIPVVEVFGSTETGGIGSRNRYRGEDHFTAFPAVDWKTSNSRLCVRSPFTSPDAPCDRQGFFLSGDHVVPVDNRTFSLSGRVDDVTKVGGKRVNLEGCDQCCSSRKASRTALFLLYRSLRGGGTGLQPS